MDYFVNLCRICMSRNGKLHDIYQPDTDTIKYIDKLWICFPELFSAENFVSLSHQICEKCCSNLKTVFIFRNLCMNTNYILKEVELKFEAETKNCTEYGSDNDNGVGNVEVEINEITGDDDSEFYLSVTDSAVTIQSRKISTAKQDDNIVDKVISQDEENDDISAPNNSEAKAEYSLDKKWKKPYYRKVGSDRYPCPKCNKGFRFLHEMQSHKREHANVVRTRKPRTCLICMKTFSKHYSLKSHMLKKHMSVILAQEEELNTAGEQFNPETMYPSEEVFPPEGEALNNIIETHYMHEENIEEDILNSQDNLPDKKARIPEGEALNNIIETHYMHEENIEEVILNSQDNLPDKKARIPCHLCHKSFSDKKYFRKHLLYHENDQRFVCELCNQNFTTKSHLTRHIKAQKCVRLVAKEPIVSPVPPEKKVLKKRLKKERMTGWKVEVDPKDVRKQDSLVCTICSIEFATKYFLTKHMLIHEKDESLICTVCSEECTTKYFLKKHMLMHEKRKFSCTKCLLEFKLKSDLDKHNKNNHLEEDVPKKYKHK